jgi:hypothetical protein
MKEGAMTKAHKHWKVQPHDTLSHVDDDILTVVGRLRMPLGDFPRRMTIVRLSDSRLIIWSAMAVNETELAKLEAFGRPAFLVVPNDHHRLDAKAWKERYPQVQVVAPYGSRGKVEEVVPVDMITPDFGDERVRFLTVPGTREREAALLVSTSSGTTLVLNDIVGNIRRKSGIAGWLLELAGFAGNSARIPRIVKLKMVEDENALRGQLSAWAELPTLKTILVSHGDAITYHPRQALRALARTLP